MSTTELPPLPMHPERTMAWTQAECEALRRYGADCARAALAPAAPNPPAAAPAFDADAAKRLRAICGLLGLATAVPPDDATLMGALFTVLGMVRGRIEKLMRVAGALAEPGVCAHGVRSPHECKACADQPSDSEIAAALPNLKPTVYVQMIAGRLYSAHDPDTYANGLARGFNVAEYQSCVLQADAERAIAAARAEGLSAAVRDVLAERARCISAEGWTPAHDDEHDPGELAAAAAAYAVAAADALHPLSQGDGGFSDEPPVMWPWGREWWKPASPRRMLEKAGQLVLAQMECIDRAAAKERGHG